MLRLQAYIACSFPSHPLPLHRTPPLPRTLLLPGRHHLLHHFLPPSHGPRPRRSICSTSLAPHWPRLRSAPTAPDSAPAAGGGAGTSGSAGKPAAKRVMKTPYQLEVLEKTYTEDPYPDKTLRAELLVKLGLTDRQLQMWFCHRRFKDRKPLAKLQQREEEVAVPVIAPPPVLPPSLPHSELTVGFAGTYGEQLLPCSQRGPGRSSAVPRISVPEIGRRYYEPPQFLLPPLAPMQLTRAEHQVIDSVQELIGEPLREDGPVLGFEFDPLLPGAFGAPIEKQKQPF